MAGIKDKVRHLITGEWDPEGRETSTERESAIRAAEIGVPTAVAAKLLLSSTERNNEKAPVKALLAHLGLRSVVRNPSGHLVPQSGVHIRHIDNHFNGAMYPFGNANIKVHNVPKRAIDFIKNFQQLDSDPNPGVNVVNNETAQIGRQAPLQVRLTSDPVPGAPAGKWYSKDSRTGNIDHRPFVRANVHSNPEILAHELGHAANRKYFSDVSPWARRAHLLSTTLLPAATEAAALGMASTNDPFSNQVKYAPLVALGGILPRLIEEGVASHRGLKALKATGISDALYRTSRNNLAKAWGTYGLAGAAAVAAPYMIGKWRQEKYRKEHPIASVLT